MDWMTIAGIGLISMAASTGALLGWWIARRLGAFAALFDADDRRMIAAILVIAGLAGGLAIFTAAIAGVSWRIFVTLK